MDSDDELAEIRRRKMQEMQRSAMDDQASAEEQRRAQELEKARKQQILRQILTPDARERLSRVRLVKPELAENVENQLIQLAGMGRVNRMISDQDVREILDKLTSTKRESKIEWRGK
ncbi:MAG: DNA-binding protein [Thermoplasmataceae archaeon]|jgi:programmed cell death protein 5